MLNSVADDIASAWNWLFSPTPVAIVQFTPRIFPTPSSPSSSGSPATPPPATSLPPTVINHQTTVTQNITADQLDQIRSYLSSDTNTYLQPLQSQVAMLAASLSTLEQRTGIQAPPGFSIGAVYQTASNPNAAGTIGGITYFGSKEITSETLTVSGAATLNTLNVSGALTANSLIVQAPSASIANLQEWRDNSGAMLAAIRNNSSLFFVSGGHEVGRASLQLRDTVSNRSLELGFYQYGTSLVTYTPDQVTAPLEFMPYSGVISIRNNNASTPLSHRLEVRQPDDAPGINLESGYKKADAGAIYGAYIYDDFTSSSRPLFIQASDGTGLYIEPAGTITVGGRILPAATRQSTRFFAADATVTSDVAFGYRHVDGYDATTWRLRMAAGARKIGLVYDTTGSSEVVANGLYLTDDPRLGYGTNAPTARIDVRGSGASGEGTVPLLALRPASGHTANLQEWQNSSGAALSVVNSAGNVAIGTTTPKSKFTLVDTLIGSISSGSFAIRSSNTIGTVASISATALTTGAALSIRVSASTSFFGPILVATDTNGVVLASLSSGGRFSIRRTMFSHGADTTNCTGVGAPSSGCIDYAESMPTDDATIEAGDIIAVSETSQSGSGDTLKVVKSQRKGDGSVLGIVSTNPAALITGNTVKLGDEANHYHQDGFVSVALAGRVPVKTSLENGPIQPGDKLTASSIPGIAMKATQPGQIIGTALEPLDTITAGSYQKIMVFVNVGYWAPSVDSVLASASLDPMLALQTTTGSRFTLSTLFDFILDQFKHIGVMIHDGLVQANIIKANQQLCVGDTCVNEDQLKQLLQNAGTSAPTPTPSPSATPAPTPTPSDTPTPSVTPSDTPSPSASPSSEPTPTSEPSASPTPEPSPSPTPTP